MKRHQKKTTERKMYSASQSAVRSKQGATTIAMNLQRLGKPLVSSQKERSH